MLKLTHSQWHEPTRISLGERAFGYCFTSCIQSLKNFFPRIKNQLEKMFVTSSSTLLLLTDDAREWRLNEMAFNKHRRGISRRTWRRRSAMLSLMQQKNFNSR